MVIKKSSEGSWQFENAILDLKSSTMATKLEQQENEWTEVITPQDSRASIPPQTAPSSPTSTSSPRSKSRNAQAKIVFSSESHYHPLLWVIVAFPLVAIVIQFTVIVLDSTVVEFRKEQQAWSLSWSLILILGIYSLILPRRVDVRSNGSIGIKTFLMTYRFKDAVRAYQAGLGREDFLRPRLKFASSFFPPHRVVIRRRGGKWDLLVSPSEPEEFIKAVEDVVSKLEQEHQTENASKEEGKPDLSLV